MSPDATSPRASLSSPTTHRSQLVAALTARCRTALAELDRALPEIRSLARQLIETVPAEERAAAEAAEGDLPYPLSLAGAADCLTRESAPAVYADLWQLATACDAEPYGRALDPEALWRRWEGEASSSTRLRSERVQEPGGAQAAPDPALEETWPAGAGKPDRP